LKFLVIAALLALLLLLLYSRLYPYVQFVKKILGVAKTIVQSPSGLHEETRSASTKGARKLVRCVGCGTWIPAARAIETRGAQSVYCSRECIEKTANGKERKIAG
jgi:lysine/ornithine N-monooxygenase